MVWNGASSQNIFPDIIFLEGHQNRCCGSIVTAILLNEWILLTGGVASGRVCPAACTAGLFTKQTLVYLKNCPPRLVLLFLTMV